MNSIEFIHKIGWYIWFLHYHYIYQTSRITSEFKWVVRHFLIFWLRELISQCGDEFWIDLNTERFDLFDNRV
jgi:hypothetical protein